MTKFQMNIANFNLTYGKEEYPMLKFFEEIVYPAFKANLKREYENSNFFFMNIKLVETFNGLALTGILVNDTEIDINSIYNHNTNELDSTNEVYSSAPYSLFYIFLKNHRMIYIKNQKESPSLNTFSATTRFILKEYRKKENYQRRERNEELLPVIHLNVVGIPNKNDLLTELENVERIKQLHIRFYPLNGDDKTDINKISNNLLDTALKMREFSGSSTGNINFNSPKNKKNVAEFVSNLRGNAESTLDTTFKDGSHRKIKTNTVKQNINFQVKGKDSKQIDKNREKVLEHAKNISEITDTSKNNESLYNRIKNKLKKKFLIN